MENYEIVSRLGRGAQGSVFLVQRLDNGKQYVLKKVECNDEGEANKAFQEAMALQELQHPYVCGYKEFFVTWDEEVAAMFVCIVMEYYKNGDLDRVLKQRRISKQPIEELILKKWLGQIVEALIFVHKKQVIHRDLKPSNIFMREDLSISLGDFGVATIMGDAKTRTRTAVGTMNWMAPEVLERPYDERSDVWSAGCIALEMATCGILDRDQMSKCLFDIKSNPAALEEALTKIKEKYPEDLASVIKTMLQHDFSQRPSAVELLSLPYIRECLSISSSQLVDSKRKDVTSVKKNPVPKGKGCPAVFEYIKQNHHSENCVKEALKYVEELSRTPNKHPVDTSEKKLLVQAMKDHLKCTEIQTLGYQIINNLIVGAKDSDILYTREVINVIPLSMKAHSDSPTLLKAAVVLLTALSSDESATQAIGACGGIQDILACMRRHSGNAELVAASCNALWSLTVNEANAKILTEEHGLPDVVTAMATHRDSALVIESAAAALLSLSMEDGNAAVLSEQECVTHLVQALQTHIKQAKVVKNACMALASLVEQDEESAYKVLSNPSIDGTAVAGIPIIIAAYNKHKDNADVVENVCTLFMELAEYNDILSEMGALKCEKVMADVMRRFKENQDIMTPCMAALDKLSAHK
ncbi:serine/threonine kinase-like domain-containing protein STKLD1 [Watersipora subatra]|uniref:serine/threonine kinase-like domain-containing protein STKLD1 n=1 Tax=Watersipora subatra TaxID=2589382 RepID=UPI00355C5332